MPLVIAQASLDRRNAIQKQIAKLTKEIYTLDKELVKRLSLSKGAKVTYPIPGISEPCVCAVKGVGTAGITLHYSLSARIDEARTVELESDFVVTGIDLYKVGFVQHKAPENLPCAAKMRDEKKSKKKSSKKKK